MENFDQNLRELVYNRLKYVKDYTVTIPSHDIKGIYLIVSKTSRSKKIHLVFRKDTVFLYIQGRRNPNNIHQKPKMLYSFDYDLTFAVIEDIEAYCREICNK